MSPAGGSVEVELVEVEFTAPVWHWRGPAPYHFVTLPDQDASVVGSVAPAVTYGWGMVPVSVRVGDTTWGTSLFPKGGGYVLPLRDSVRRRERIDLGDVVTVTLRVIGG